ncbi:MAG: hypothetical protein WEB60_03895 [Terrimicrobiaceae bacterium]
MSTLSFSLAQDFIVPLPEAEEIVPVEVEPTQPTIEGIVKDIFETRKPWQMVNPAAPASFGSGEKNVSKDFGPGTPVKSAGLIIFGIEW